MTDFKYFNMSEFECPCCGENKMSESVVKMLDQAREIASIVFFVNSGYRCHNHNKEVGGKPLSSHVLGVAADLKANNSRERFLILDALLGAGFKRIGIAKTFIHADDDESKDSKVIWLY